MDCVNVYSYSEALDIFIQVEFGFLYSGIKALRFLLFVSALVFSVTNTSTPFSFVILAYLTGIDKSSEAVFYDFI